MKPTSAPSHGRRVAASFRRSSSTSACHPLLIPCIHPARLRRCRAEAVAARPPFPVILLNDSASLKSCPPCFVRPPRLRRCFCAQGPNRGPYPSGNVIAGVAVVLHRPWTRAPGLILTASRFTGGSPRPRTIHGGLISKEEIGSRPGARDRTQNTVGGAEPGRIQEYGVGVEARVADPVQSEPENHF